MNKITARLPAGLRSRGALAAGSAVLGAGLLAAVLFLSFGAVGGTRPVPGPTTTSYQTVSGPVQTVEGPTVTETDTVTASANAQGQAIEISADGVYVVGQDIAGGTWHTAGDGGQTGDQCYYATLGSTDTGNIIDNNNFDGPETVSVSNAAAFEISGACTWDKISG